MPRPAGRGPRAIAFWGAVLALLVLLPRRASAQSGQVSSQECCIELLLTIGGRALGLANAVSARTNAGALFVNPALIADVSDDLFLVHNANTALDPSNTFSLLIHSDLVGTFALSYRLVDYGEQQFTDPGGGSSGTITALTQVLTATYATPVAGGLRAGVSYKLFQLRNDCRGACQSFAATTHGLDLGVQLLPPTRYFSLGASILQMGFPLQVVNKEQASPMPLRVHAGAAYEVAHHFAADSSVAVWLSTDLVSSPRTHAVNVNAAAEVGLDNTIFLRAGWASGSGLLGGAGVGVGLRYDRFEVDVAKAFVTSELDVEGPIHVTFAIRF